MAERARRGAHGSDRHVQGQIREGFERHAPHRRRAVCPGGLRLDAQPYLDAISSRFGAGLRLVDYLQAAEAARVAINGWVSDRTEQRIPELLERGTIDEMTRLVLVNAIYLKAAWLAPFDEKMTVSGPFTRLDGSTFDVAYMRETEDLRYAEGDGWRAVELPYVGDQLAMTLIVPDDLVAFQADLDGATFSAIVATLADRNVELSLPRFSIETKTDLATVLAAEMGMPLAFDPVRADFSGMTAAEQLYISAVIHQANIDVNEKGTTAAAATAVVLRATSAPSSPITMKVNQPFLAVRGRPRPVRSCSSGRVVEPAIRRKRPDHPRPRAIPQFTLDDSGTAPMTSPGGLALATRGLRKSYGSRLALDGLDLSVPTASSTGSSAPTAPARPRRCASSPGCSTRTRARSSCSASRSGAVTGSACSRSVR